MGFDFMNDLLKPLLTVGGGVVGGFFGGPPGAAIGAGAGNLAGSAFTGDLEEDPGGSVFGAGTSGAMGYFGGSMFGGGGGAGGGMEGAMNTEFLNAAPSGSGGFAPGGWFPSDPGGLSEFGSPFDPGGLSEFSNFLSPADMDALGLGGVDPFGGAGGDPDQIGGMPQEPVGGQGFNWQQFLSRAMTGMGKGAERAQKQPNFAPRLGGGAEARLRRGGHRVAPPVAKAGDFSLRGLLGMLPNTPGAR